MNPFETVCSRMAEHLGIGQALECPQHSQCDSTNWITDAWANISILDGN
jgi:hypothetical protein